MNPRTVSRLMNFIEEVVKMAIVLAIVTAALSWALFRVLGVNPFSR